MVPFLWLERAYSREKRVPCGTKSNRHLS
jgi:hypothetical protein